MIEVGKTLTGIYIWEGGESALSKICAAINDDMRFVDGLIKIGKLFIGRQMDNALIAEANAAIDYYLNAWFVKYTDPGWHADCVFKHMSSSIGVMFKTMSGEVISAEEAQSRIDKYGWRLREFEEERAQRFREIDEVDAEFETQRQESKSKLISLGLTEEQITVIEKAIDDLFVSLADENFLEDE